MKEKLRLKNDPIENNNKLLSYLNGYIVTDVNAESFVTLAAALIVCDKSFAFVQDVKP